MGHYTPDRGQARIDLPHTNLAKILDRLPSDVMYPEAFDPLPFDGNAARAYGRIFAVVTASGRKARGARAVDSLVAATALGSGLPVYTRNSGDLRALESLVDVITA